MTDPPSQEELEEIKEKLKECLETVDELMKEKDDEDGLD